MNLEPISFALATDPSLRSRVLLLNPDLAMVYTLRRSITRFGNGAIRTRGGLALPNEMWAMILAEAERAAGNSERRVVVRASAARTVSLGSGRVVLRCVRQAVTGGGTGGGIGALPSANCVAEFDEYLTTGAQSAALAAVGAPVVLGGHDVWYVVVCAGGHGGVDVGLYVGARTADVLAWTGARDGSTNNDCRVCGGTHFVCPCGSCERSLPVSFRECRGVALRPLDLCDAFLACPLCMGPEVARDHWQFLEATWDRTNTGEEGRVWAQVLSERLASLGYAPQPHVVEGYGYYAL